MFEIVSISIIKQKAKEAAINGVCCNQSNPYPENSDAYYKFENFYWQFIRRIETEFEVC